MDAVLLNGHVVKIPPKYLCSCRCICAFPTLVRKVSYYSRHCLLQRKITGQCAENK